MIDSFHAKPDAGAAPDPEFSGTVTARSGMAGYVQLAPSGSASDGATGQVRFFTGPDGVRRGWLGGKGVGDALQLVLETGWTLEMVGGAVSVGGPAGAEGLRVEPVAGAVNRVAIAGAPAAASPRLAAAGADANVALALTAKGAGAVVLQTDGGTTQATVTHTAGADRHLTLTGSSGGNPALGSTAGGIALAPGGTTRLLVDGAGNVGIGGTTTPDGALVVHRADAGAVAWTSIAAATVKSGLTLHNPDDTTDSGTFVRFRGRTSAPATAAIASTTTGAGTADLRFITETASLGEERLRITGAGTVHFPTLGITASGANAHLRFASSPANELLRSTSSGRYKTEVEALDPDRADAVIAGARPVWYRSLAAADRPDWSWYGLIAEELAAIDPRLVVWAPPGKTIEETIRIETGRDPSGAPVFEPRTLIRQVPDTAAPLIPDAVQYDRLTVMLLSVVQRLVHRIDTLDAQIQALSGSAGAAEGPPDAD